MEEAKEGSGKEEEAELVRFEYISEDEDLSYEEVPALDEDEEEALLGLQGEETLASIERNLSKHVSEVETDVRVEGNEEKVKANGPTNVQSKTEVRPAVVDDFIRGVLISYNMPRALDAFNAEWYELKAKGKLGDEQMEAVPDVYIRNQELEKTVKDLRAELAKKKEIANKAKSAWDKFRKERDFHRLNHQRVVQEKNKMIDEIKRLQKHYNTFKPTIEQLRQKYELAMKQKMLVKIERDKLAARIQSLEMQMEALEDIKNEGKNGSAEDSSLKSSHHHRKIADRPHGGLPEFDHVNPYLDQKFEKVEARGLQLLKTFEGHVNAVSSLAYHPKKQVIASASDDQTWKLWSIPNGDLIMSGEGHLDWVAGIDFNPAGTQLLSASGDGTVKLWDFEQAACAATLADHAQPVWDVSWHYTGSFAVSCSMDRSAKLWDLERLKAKQTFRGHVDSVNAVVFQPYSSNVCTASGDKTVSMWDARSGLCIQTFFGHNNACNGICINLQGDLIASCDADGIVKVWDVRMVQEMMTLDAGHHSLNDICMDRSGKIIAVASDEGSVRMFDRETAQLAAEFKNHEDTVQAVVFDPNSKFFVSGASDKTFRVYKSN